MGDLEVSGEDVYLEGIVIFDPCTAIRITEESANGQPLPIRVQGQLIGMRVEIEGDRFSMRGTERLRGRIVLSLFE